MSVETKQLNCINCPMGCLLTVTLEDGKVTNVTGNTCPRGETYAHQELTDPQRMLTSTVSIEGGELPLLPVVSKTTFRRGKSSTAPGFAQRPCQSSDQDWRCHRQRYLRPRCRYRSQPGHVRR